MNLVLSAEHATPRIPARRAGTFRGARRALDSHRGWDAGSLALARAFARRYDAPLVAARVSRLLIDANRSLGHPALFSEWTHDLPEAERARLVERWWRPHREAVADLVTGAPRGTVLHLAVHSFTPVWNGVERDVDVGLLYDPARPRERSFCARWIAALREREPSLRVRRNQPYRGIADGLTTAFRRRFGAARYLGIELEVSQRIAVGPARERRALFRALVDTLDA